MDLDLGLTLGFKVDLTLEGDSAVVLVGFVDGMTAGGAMLESANIAGFGWREDFFGLGLNLGFILTGCLGSATVLLGPASFCSFVVDLVVGMLAELVFVSRAGRI